MTSTLLSGNRMGRRVMEKDSASEIGDNKFARVHFPEVLASAELVLVRARREALGDALDPQEPTGRAALAISGGGIRSATFALGVLQALAELRRLRKFDYLSTVSGGGYVGSFFGTLYLPAGIRENCETTETVPSACDTVDQVEKVLGDAASAPVNWLRENGRYITPKGAGDYFYAAAIFVRNWVALHCVFAISTLTVFLSADLARVGLAQHVELARRVEAMLRPVGEAAIWWSPYAVLPIAGAAFALVPLGWAYWLTQISRGRLALVANPTLIGTLLVLAAGVVAFCEPGNWPPLPNWVRTSGAYLAYAALAASVLWGLARWIGGSESVARNRLSTGLAAALRIALVLLAFALVDTFGQSVYGFWRSSGFTGLGSMLAALIPGAIATVVHRLAPIIDKLGVEERGLRIPAATLLAIVGLVLFAVLMVFWSAIGHGIFWAGGYVTGVEPAQPPLTPALVAFAGFGVLTVLTGRTIPFLNLSTLAQFYSARLTRAYLGASNPGRTGYRSDAPAPTGVPTDSRGRDVTRAQTSDDIPWHRYRPERYGGPLHLVNVTLNETVSGTSQLEQRDRKGISMAVGPCGISVGAVHHALWDAHDDGMVRPVPLTPDRFAVFPAHGSERLPVEALTVGQWVAISGAAFTTGLGSRTRLGLSALLAVSNVRLGYWWDSGIAPSKRPSRVPVGFVAAAFEFLSGLLPVQSYLSNETFARFHGPHRTRWYLSDGGHFENTGVYELLRRRVPFIVVCDDGADEQYAFADLGNLVRKARIDYCAEIRFLTKDEIAALLGSGSPLLDVIGTLPQLQRRESADTLQGRAYAERHAALAWVHYDGTTAPGSFILVLKPTLVGNEPLDVLQYHGEHPDFPQQTTADQFFDEAKWESYRRLGRHIAEVVFRAPAMADHWAPSDLRMPSSELVQKVLRIPSRRLGP